MADRKDLPRPLQALLTGAAVALVVGLLYGTGALTLWELKTRDWRTKWTLRADRKDGEPFVRPDVMMIDVTDDSLSLMDKNKHVKWPWDREIQAYFIKACRQGKASCVLYDFLLSETGDADDQKPFVEAMAAGPPTYLCGGFRERRTGTSEDRKDYEDVLKKHALDLSSDGSVEVPERYEFVVLPTPEMSKTTAGVCDISTPRDGDGMIRRYRLFSVFKGRYYPSFALAALMAREKTSKVTVRDRRLTVGSVTIPIEKDASILLRYYPPGSSFERKSAWNVVNNMAGIESGEKPTFDLDVFRGKAVIVGTSAVGMTDLRVTPVSEVMAGPEVHMTSYSNLLNGDYLRETGAGVSVLLFSLLAVGIAMSTRFTSAAAGGAIAAAAIGVALGSSVALYKERWIVDLVPQLFAVVFAFAATSAVNFLHEGRQRMQVKRIFGQYVSKKVVEKILRHQDALHLEGERKPLTIFFMDFAGFTAMSEKLDPAELVKLISEYHNEAAEEIFKTEGTLDKFIGDAIMAYWNDPVGQEDHALRACLTAIGAQKRLLQMAAKMKDRGLPEMSARIGLNTGVATVGNMGSKEQVNYTLIGDEVNLASRLEGVNKEFGTKIIVSEATYLPAKERLDVRELALIKVKGKKLPVRIYELIGLKGEAPPERMELVKKFEDALAQFRARKFHASWEAFLSLAQKGDHASEVYVGLCERYMNEPPPPDWDGSYQMEHK